MSECRLLTLGLRGWLDACLGEWLDGLNTLCWWVVSLTQTRVIQEEETSIERLSVGKSVGAFS